MGRPLKIQQYSLGSGDTGTSTTAGLGVPVVVDSAYPIFGQLTSPVYPATYTTAQYFGVVGGSNTVPGQAMSLTGANYPTVKFVCISQAEVKMMVLSSHNVAHTPTE